MNKTAIFILVSLIFSETCLAQSNVRIVVTSSDSVYKWEAVSSDGTGIKELSVSKGVIIDYNNKSYAIAGVFSMCGRGNCGDGVEINYFANGMMKSKGQYGYTTGVDSLKDTGRDGYLDYIGKTGWWYYWNEQGFLIRKEKWVKNKRMQVINYITNIAPATGKKTK